MARKTTLMQRWCSKVVLPADPDGCWGWTGHHSQYGYGRFYYDGQIRNAHRYAYLRFVATEPLPTTSKWHVDHLCRNRGCVNPAHLELVSRKTNILRGENPWAKRARVEHCPKGHPYDAENTYWNNGNRNCKKCNREIGRRASARRSANRQLLTSSNQRKQEGK